MPQFLLRLKKPDIRPNGYDMSVPVKLGLYGVVLILVFGAAFVAGRVLVPSTAAEDWAEVPTDELTDESSEPREGEDHAPH